MDSTELRRNLRFGFGRVVVFPREVDAVAYRDVILDACLHNDVYDPQFNQYRPEYLWEVIQATRDADFYRIRLLAALPTSDQIDDGEMIPALIARFAAEGDTEAKVALRAAAEHEPFGYQGEALIDAEGANGFLFLAEVIGNRDPDEGDDWSDWLVLWTDAVDRLGEEVVKGALQSASARIARIAEFQVNLQRACAWGAGSHLARVDPSRISYEDMRLWIEDGNAPSRVNCSPMRWGRFASDEDILRAAQDFLRVPDGDLYRLDLYLQMFHFRGFPVSPSRLVVLAGSDDKRIATRALIALEHVCHPEVRQLAMTLQTSKIWWKRHRSVGLLTNNYLAGDHVMIEQLIVAEPDEEVIHAYGIYVRDIYDVAKDSTLVHAFLLLYERDPCPTCRCFLVKYLHDMDALPDWIADECILDADPDLRIFARGLVRS